MSDRQEMTFILFEEWWDCGFAKEVVGVFESLEQAQGYHRFAGGKRKGQPCGRWELFEGRWELQGCRHNGYAIEEHQLVQ